MYENNYDHNIERNRRGEEDDKIEEDKGQEDVCNVWDACERDRGREDTVV